MLQAIYTPSSSKFGSFHIFYSLHTLHSDDDHECMPTLYHHIIIHWGRWWRWSLFWSSHCTHSLTNNTDIYTLCSWSCSGGGSRNSGFFLFRFVFILNFIINAITLLHACMFILSRRWRTFHSCMYTYELNLR